MSLPRQRETGFAVSACGPAVINPVIPARHRDVAPLPYDARNFELHEQGLKIDNLTEVVGYVRDSWLRIYIAFQAARKRLNGQASHLEMVNM